MPLISWRDKLSVGIDEIDEDHKILIDHLNNVYDAVQKGQTRKQVAETLEGLIEYTRDHFAREEAVMRAVEYPDYKKHKKAHEELTKQVKQVAQDFVTKDDYEIGQEVFDFLQRWLTDHIITMDRPIAKYTKERKVWNV